MSAQPKSSATFVLPVVASAPTPTSAEIIQLQGQFPRVLSAEAGQLLADGDLRKRACLLTDPEGLRGQLHISQAHRIDHSVLSYEERIRRSGVAFTTVSSTLEDIAKLYHGYEEQTSKGTDDSANQTRIINLARDAAARGASDIHFYVKTGVCQIRFRIHGVLSTQKKYQFTAEEGLSLIRTMYNTMSMEGETQLDPSREQDAQLQQQFAEKAKLTGSRIATRPAIERGLLVVLRLMLPDDGKSVTLESLGYLPEQLKQINYMTARTHGINIFTGVTGSGKSTSLKACVEQTMALANQELHGITLESPTEYRLNGEGIVQTPVNGAKDKDGWARAIRNAMRLDPDLIMIGEIRDPASATTAFDAAQTGHVVWSTLHTNDAAASLQRLKRLGVDEDFLFDPSLVTGLINQSLVPKVCSSCSLPYAGNEDRVPEDVKERLIRVCGDGGVDHVRLRGDGCAQCRDTGVSGRTVVAEVITPTPAFMDIYRREGKLPAVQHWVSQGGVTKLAHLVRLVREGTVDPVQAERVIGPLTQDSLAIGASPAGGAA